MTTQEIQELIDGYHYEDAEVKAVECNYFADEVHVCYDDENGNLISYHFLGCYKSIFDHVKEYDKFIPVRSMIQPQIPYFLQSVQIDETTDENCHFWICRINMWPLQIEIWCKDICIEKSDSAKTMEK